MGICPVTQRYYELQQSWFQRRATRDGMWLHNYHAEKVPDPWDYAYRVEVNGPRGQGWEFDARQGIPTIEYLITGMRELRRLPKVPEKYEDQIKELQNSSRPTVTIWLPTRFTGATGSNGTSSSIAGCSMEVTGTGFSPQYGLGRSEPDVSAESRSQPVLGSAGIPRWEKSPWSGCGGCFKSAPSWTACSYDSLFGWGRYFNCRTEHFPYARISLTYDPESKRPAIANMFANQEFLYALRDVLHPKGRLLMGNGPRPGRFFNGMALDILGSESTVMPRVENDIMGGAAVGGGDRSPSVWSTSSIKTRSMTGSLRVRSPT